MGRRSSFEGLILVAGWAILSALWLPIPSRLGLTLVWAVVPIIALGLPAFAVLIREEREFRRWNRHTKSRERDDP
jgi:Flp pilus assembly protein TadB